MICGWAMVGVGEGGTGVGGCGVGLAGIGVGGSGVRDAGSAEGQGVEVGTRVGAIALVRFF